MAGREEAAPNHTGERSAMDEDSGPPEEQCPICMERLSGHVSQLWCRHRFCYGCLRKTVKRVNGRNARVVLGTCPLCRRSFGVNTIAKEWTNYRNRHVDYTGETEAQRGRHLIRKRRNKRRQERRRRHQPHKLGPRPAPAVEIIDLAGAGDGQADGGQRRRATTGVMRRKCNVHARGGEGGEGEAQVEAPIVVLDD